jgi:predicted MFS family arabinose efflux permease
VPFGIVAAVAASLYLRELRNRDAEVKLDVTGAVLITGGLASIIYGVVNTTTHGWGSSFTLSWFIGGAIALIAFLFWESNVASHPLVPFRIFKSRALTSANLVMFLVGGAFFAMWYFLTYYFQSILHFGPVKAGFAFLPMAIGIIVGAQISSRIMTRTGARPILMTGTAMATLGFLWISLIKVDSSYWGSVFVPAVLCAFAMGLLFSPLANAATSGVDRADAGLASGVLNTSRQVGGSLALAVLATIAADRSATFLHPASGAALVSGYERTFQVSALITLVALGASFLVPKKVVVVAKH